MNTHERSTTFVVPFRAAGVDGARALRGALKVALRRFGLHLDAREIADLHTQE
jgi:hypothetical protein